MEDDLEVQIIIIGVEFLSENERSRTQILCLFCMYAQQELKPLPFFLLGFAC